jgi:hypothetical protein
MRQIHGEGVRGALEARVDARARAGPSRLADAPTAYGERGGPAVNAAEEQHAIAAELDFMRQIHGEGAVGALEAGVDARARAGPSRLPDAPAGHSERRGTAVRATEKQAAIDAANYRANDRPWARALQDWRTRGPSRLADAPAVYGERGGPAVNAAEEQHTIAAELDFMRQIHGEGAVGALEARVDARAHAGPSRLADAPAAYGERGGPAVNGAEEQVEIDAAIYRANNRSGKKQAAIDFADYRADNYVDHEGGKGEIHWSRRVSEAS